MLKESYHPKAHLQKIKNIRSGLSARTRILDALDLRSSDAATVAKEKSLSYAVVLHHLRLLEEEGTVTRKGKRPCSWLLTGLGQKRLIV
jgi:predicted transcriptional regulator